jgi:hypothetical protein
MRYYVVELEYVGPNQDDDTHIDADRVQVWANAPRTNMTHEARTQGWCGTTNDWATYAHGEYLSLCQAISAIESKFGPVRDVTQDDPDTRRDLSECIQGKIYASYRKGAYGPLSKNETIDWAYESIREYITAATTDVKIEALIEDYELAANEEGLTLNKRALKDCMEERRQELREELAEEETS